jgi:hypothetical protein
MQLWRRPEENGWLFLNIQARGNLYWLDIPLFGWWRIFDSLDDIFQLV